MPITSSSSGQLIQFVFALILPTAGLPTRNASVNDLVSNAESDAEKQTPGHVFLGFLILVLGPLHGKIAILGSHKNGAVPKLVATSTSAPAPHT